MEIKFPMNGKCINIEEVPDKVFAMKMVGDGVAFIPYEGLIYSPVDGEIVQLFPTKHAIAIRTVEGIELLIHVGIDTVHMNGEGFEYFVLQNQNVKSGDKIMAFDIELVKDKATSTISPMLITNMDIVSKIDFQYEEGQRDSTAMIVELK
jgi:sugar PTS system EIIA component